MEAQAEEDAPQRSPQTSTRPPLAFIEPVLSFRHIDCFLFARIMIENQSRTCPIVYRVIKPYNTSSGRYKVRPLMGVIEGGGVASVHVDVNPGLAPLSVNSDFFQVVVLSAAGTSFEFRGNTDRNVLRLFWMTANDEDPDYINIACKISKDVNKAVCIARAQEKAKAKDAVIGLLDGTNGLDLGPEFRSTPIRTWKRISGSTDVKDDVSYLANNITLWANYTTELQQRLDKLQFKFWVMFCVVIVSMIVYSATLSNYLQLQQFGIRFVNQTMSSLDKNSESSDQVIEKYDEENESGGSHLHYVVIFSICAAALTDFWKSDPNQNPASPEPATDDGPSGDQ